MQQRRFRLFLIIILAVMGGALGLAFQSGLLAAPAAQTGDPVIVAAGDISNCSNEQDFETGYLIEGIDGPVLALGDNAYEAGTLQEFQNCYDPAWGRHKARTHPVPGNHEYITGGASGYYTYFGDAATPLEPGCTKECKGYYSFDVGAWHLIALNSETPGDPGTEQEQWLRADLAAHPTQCTLAYWHKPRFSSGDHGNGAGQGLWNALYDYGADIVLVGHDHDYERFAPQDGSAQYAPDRGIREFVVGTGGAQLRDFRFIQPNSEVHNSETFGVLKLTLHPASYDWEFIPIPSQTFRDAGSGQCVSAGNLPVAPAPVAAPNTPAPTTVNTQEVAPTAAPVTLPPGGNYSVQAGDTLFGIALRFGLDWTKLAAANQLTENSILQIGQTLRLPGVAADTIANTAPVTTTKAVSITAVATKAPPTPGAKASPPPGSTRYTVKAGDTLFSIALQYDLSWPTVGAANGLGENDLLRIGQELIIPVPAASQTTAQTPITTTTALTTTLTAKPTATPVAKPSGNTALPTATPAAPSETLPEFYVVTNNDTIITIALSYGVDWQELMRLNGLTRDSTLQVGQRLRLR